MKKFVFSLALAISCILLYTVMFNSKKTETIHFNKEMKMAMGIGTKEDKFARFNYEHKRLVDPATGKIPENIRSKELAFAKTLQASRKQNNAIENLEWKNRGPFNVGGRTRAFAIDVTNEDVMLAGSASGGVYKSINGGENWYRVSLPDDVLSITTIVQDPRPGHTNEWYYGTGELFGGSQSEPGAFYLGNGIYKSEDNGETWTSLSNTASNTPQSFDQIWDAVWRIAIDPSNLNETEIYVATYQSIHRSINGGQNWQTVLSSPSSGDVSYFTEVNVTSDGVVYAGMSSENQIIGFGLAPNGGFWRSETGDLNSFTNLSDAVFPPQYNRIVTGINPSNENEMYLLVSNVTEGYGNFSINWVGDTSWNALYKYTYISGDGTGAGGEWIDLSPNLYRGPLTFDDFESQSGYNLTVAVKPDDANTVIIGGTNLYRSTDAFSTSNNITVIGGYNLEAQLPLVLEYPNHHPDNHGLFFKPSDPNVLYSIHDGGISKTNNIMAPEIEWEAMIDGYITTQFYTLGFYENDTSNFLIGGLQDNGTYLNLNGNQNGDWQSPWGGDGSFMVLPDHKEFIVTSLQSGRIYMLKVNDYYEVTAFERIDPALPRSEFQFIHPFEMDPFNNDRIYLPIGNKIFRKSDLSQTQFYNSFDSTNVGWEVFDDSLLINQGEITAISLSHSTPTQLYFGTELGNIFRISNTSDLSTQFEDLTPLNFPNANISCIAVNPEDENELLTVFTNYSVHSLWYSKNGGTTWKRAAGNLEQNQVGSGNGPSFRWATILPTDTGTNYFVGTSIGLFHISEFDTVTSVNNIWTQVALDTIGTSIVNVVKSRPLDGYLAVATHGSGVFTANTPEDIPIVSNENIDRPKVDFKLFPNPASSYVNVKIELEQNQKVQVTILDELGKITQVEKTMQLNNGENNLSLNLRNLSAGIYYCNVKSENFEATKTLLIQ